MSTRTEYGYGFFCGGDPRKFHPDGECCSEKEIANHKAACALWDEMEARGETPTPEACPSGWVYDADGKPIMHVLRAPYGIGMYEYDVDDDEDSEEGGAEPVGDDDGQSKSGACSPSRPISRRGRRTRKNPRRHELSLSLSLSL